MENYRLMLSVSNKLKSLVQNSFKTKLTLNKILHHEKLLRKSKNYRTR